MELRPLGLTFAGEQLAHDGALLGPDEETYRPTGSGHEIVRDTVVGGDRKRVEAPRQVGEHRVRGNGSPPRGCGTARAVATRRWSPRGARTRRECGRLARARGAAHAQPPLVVVDHLLFRGRQLHRPDLTSGP